MVVVVVVVVNVLVVVRSCVALVSGRPFLSERHRVKPTNQPTDRQSWQHDILDFEYGHYTPFCMDKLLMRKFHLFRSV